MPKAKRLTPNAKISALSVRRFALSLIQQVATRVIQQIKINRILAGNAFY